MSTAFLRQGSHILQNRKQGILFQNSTFGLRYASLNSGIARGLRKSQGVGFRGRERTDERSPRNSTSNNCRSTVRRTSDVPSIVRPESPMSRESWRKQAGSGDRNVFGKGKDATTRLRRGKVDVKDTERPVKRSRAARFHDPDSSFGKRSAARKDNFPPSRGRESSWNDRDADSLGRKRPSMTDTSRRAAVSDLKERERNPDGTKLSASRLAYLERSANQSARLSQPSDLPESGTRNFDRASRHLRQESRRSFDEPYKSKSMGLDREANYSRNEPRKSYDESRSTSQDFDGRRKNSYDERPKRFDDLEKSSYRGFDRESRYSRDEPRKINSGGGHPEKRGEEPEVKARSVFDKRLPLSIPYTTPASEFLYGTSVVEAALKSHRSPRRQLYKLYIYTGENRDNAESDYAMAKLARRNNIEVVRVGLDSLRLLDKMSGGRPHNGYILEASPLPKLPITSLGELTTKEASSGFTVTLDYQSREEAAINGTNTFIPVPANNLDRKPFVLLLDSILDPGNLGAIIRTASFLGVTAIAISTRNSASFTPVVLKASAGASENITLFSVNKPAGFIVDSQAAGWKVYAAVAPPGPGSKSTVPKFVTTDGMGAPLREDPCILMLGNEGEGLRWNLKSKADVEVAIEGGGDSGGVDSLNVSVATGILCNAFLRAPVQGVGEEKEEEIKENKLF